MEKTSKLFVFVCVVLLTFQVPQSAAREVTRCDLVRELFIFPVPEADIFNLVCSAMENRPTKDTRQTDNESLGIYRYVMQNLS